MSRNSRLKKCITGVGLLLLLVIVCASQQVFASPSIYFFGNYVFVSGNRAVQLTFQIEGVQLPDQIHVTVSLSKSPGVYWSETLDYYFKGFGIFNVIVPSKTGTGPFLHGYTYLATMYVYVTFNSGGSPSAYGQFAEYNIQS
ncbi:MAG TPA: hypothetical protein VJZ32_11885 [Candidatus Bathyarchaeia archaeon]|nr:hypothetical protein [Candidatus Bathyarchaeia archaeon]